jgi:hypothetical protein
MNYKKACEILDFDGTSSIEVLKKQYRIKALIFHPDKNNDPHSTNMFIQIKEAYDFLLDYYKFNDMSNGISNNMNIHLSYYDMITSFFTGFYNESTIDLLNKPVISMIIQNIISKCESRSLELLGNLDKKLLKIIYDIIIKHKDIMHLNDDFIIKVETLMKTKISGDECIILNPFIDDLFEFNLFKLNEKGNIYYIPLWHHQLIYDCCGNDLYVNCIPLLDENIKIDQYNNLHISLVYDLKLIFYNNFLEFFIGSQSFKIENEKIKIMKNQIIQLVGIGIPYINTRNVYDISKKGDIFVYLELLL